MLGARRRVAEVEDEAGDENGCQAVIAEPESEHELDPERLERHAYPSVNMVIYSTACNETKWSV